MMSEVIDDTKLSIRIEGATETEIARGIAAAQFVFARAHTRPLGRPHTRP